MSDKEKIELFKSHCRSYNLYKKRIDDIKDELIVIEYKLSGLKGISYKESIIDSFECNDQYKLGLIEKKETYIDELHAYECLINKVDNVYNKVTTPEAIRLIKDCYIDKNISVNDLADSLLLSTMTLYANANEEILLYL